MVPSSPPAESPCPMKSDPFAEGLSNQGMAKEDEWGNIMRIGRMIHIRDNATDTSLFCLPSKQMGLMDSNWPCTSFPWAEGGRRSHCRYATRRDNRRGQRWHRGSGEGDCERIDGRRHSGRSFQKSRLWRRLELPRLGDEVCEASCRIIISNCPNWSDRHFFL